MTTGELDLFIGKTINDCGVASAFKGYRGFPGYACISVNEQVIHGVGGRRRVQFGDVVKIDIGVIREGFIGDVAMSVPVGLCSMDIQKLLDTTTKALHAGISRVKAGVPILELSSAIQTTVEGAGFSVVREFVGHGVGRTLHEDPQIPNHVLPGAGGRLEAGMTIAIEPMVNAGGAAVEILDDHWTVVTRDRSMSAHFEHTVLVLENGAEILTVDGQALY
jgi:methionyl aminopeptidase